MQDKEIQNIKNKFATYIQQQKIAKPKHNKQSFFKTKAETSLELAKQLQQTNPDWAINIAYYSMFYNATSLLAHKNIDLGNIQESTHVLTYQALVYYFHIQEEIIKQEFFEEFKTSLQETDNRLSTLAEQKSQELFAQYKNAKNKRAETTYELGNIAEIQAAQTAIRRAESFDRMTTKILL